MNEPCQGYWNDTPAPAANLCGAGRVHVNDLDTSFFRFVFMHLPEQPKTYVMRGQGETPVSVHEADAKVFNHNQVILNHPITDLMKGIRPLISDALVQMGNLPVDFLPPITSFRLPGNILLQVTQLRQVLLQPARIFNQFSVRKGGEIFQAHIYTDLMAGEPWS